MKNFVTGAAIAALIAMPVSAQELAAPAVAAAAVTAEPMPAAAPQAALLALIAGTPITLAVAQEVNSSTHEAGDLFRLTVLNDVKIGETIVIPRGTPATGEITWRTGKGAFGKSGKIEFALRHIDLGGQRIPVTGSFRQEGEGNTIATGVGIIAIGVFAGFITGKRARLPQGRELMSQLAQEVQFTADGHLSPSYDAQAAILLAEANTPEGQCRTQARTLSDGKRQEKAMKKCLRERMD